MTEEIAKKASELLKRKSDISKNLSYLIEPNTSMYPSIILGGCWNATAMYGISKNINDKVKNLILTELRREEKEIDDELICLK